MELRLLFYLFLSVSAAAKNSTAEVEKNATIVPLKDAVQHSPIAYNQGSLLPAFPAVTKIRPKEKKEETELVEDVMKLVESLNHKKSHSKGPLDSKAIGYGSSRKGYLVEIDTYGDPYSSGYRGLPESQISSNYLGAITGSRKGGRNAFGSYGSVDSAKGQASLNRAGAVGSSYSSGDPYMTGATQTGVPNGWGGYKQESSGLTSNKVSGRFGSYPSPSATGGDYYQQGTDRYSSQQPTDGNNNQNYGSNYETQDQNGGQMENYGNTGSYGQEYGNQGVNQGYGNTDYSLGSSPTSSGYGTQETPDYTSQGQQSTDYSNLGSYGSNYGNQGDWNSQGQQPQTGYSNQGYGTQSYSNQEYQGYSTQGGQNYGSQTYAGNTDTSQNYQGTQDYSNQGYSGQQGTEYSNQGYGQSTGYSTSQGTDSGNYGTAQGIGYTGNQGYGTSQSTSDYTTQGYGTSRGTSDYSTQGYGTQTDYGTSASSYGSQPVTDYGNQEYSQTGSYSAAGYGSQTGVDYGSQGYGTQQGTDYSNRGYNTGYSTGTDYANQGTTYNSAGYGSQTGTDYSSQSYGTQPSTYDPYGSHQSTDYSNQGYNAYGSQDNSQSTYNPYGQSADYSTQGTQNGYDAYGNQGYGNQHTIGVDFSVNVGYGSKKKGVEETSAGKKLTNMAADVDSYKAKTA